MEAQIRRYQLTYGDRVKVQSKIHDSKFVLINSIADVYRPKKWYNFRQYHVERYYEYEYTGL